MIHALLLLAIVASDTSSQLPSPSRGVPPAWLTLAEKSDYRQTPRYDETITYCKRLADESEWIEYATFGKTPQGREMGLVIAAKGGEFTPEKAKASGKPIVLVQNGIHAGECEGKDASLMLLRDMAITKTRERLLDNAILLIIPVFNIDGHERFGPHNRINQNGPDQMGWRTTAQNYNLNRDYMKADAPEMRAWLSLWNAWLPDLHLDTHTTDGGDWQYDIMPAWDASPLGSVSVARWVAEKLEPHILKGLEADGHVPLYYFDLVDRKDPSKGIASGPFEPRFATGYVSLRNRPSVLVETHMLKPYRTRVFAQYSMIKNALELANKESESLRQANAAGDAEASRLGKSSGSSDPPASPLSKGGGLDASLSKGGGSFVLAMDTAETPGKVNFKGFKQTIEPSEISGTERISYDATSPIEMEIPYYNQVKVTATVVPPAAYIIPPQWTQVIELLRAHGLQLRPLENEAELPVESYRLTNPKFAERSFEGRIRVSFETQMVKETRKFPAGSIIVALNQPNSRVAIHLLEPTAPDSLVQWGFFNSVFEQKEYAEGYILEKLARGMLTADPALKQEFEKKLADDEKFAADPRARLYFFYQRSPYWDQSLGLYPVARLTSASDAPAVEPEGVGK